MFVGMTRPQTRTYGVVTPSTRQPLLEAMLRAFVWLVSNAVSMLATIFNRPTRDWHTADANEDQFPTPNDPTQKEADTFEPSFSGKRSARIPRIPVASTQGTTTHSPCATNQDAWDKPKHDSVIVLQTGSGPSAAFPAEARVRNGAEGAIWSGGPNRVTEAASYARGLQTLHEVRTSTLALSPLIPTKVGIQGRTRSLSRLAASTPHTHHTAPVSRRLIPSLSKDVGMSGSCCAKSA